MTQPDRFPTIDVWRNKKRALPSNQIAVSVGCGAVIIVALVLVVWLGLSSSNSNALRPTAEKPSQQPRAGRPSQSNERAAIPAFNDPIRVGTALTDAGLAFDKPMWKDELGDGNAAVGFASIETGLGDNKYVGDIRNKVYVEANGTTKYVRSCIIDAYVFKTDQFNEASTLAKFHDAVEILFDKLELELPIELQVAISERRPFSKRTDYGELSLKRLKPNFGYGLEFRIKSDIVRE